MTAARKWNLISVEDYLASELDSPIKHEYFGGHVYATMSPRNVHNAIAGSTFAALHTRLRGKSWRPYNSDTKVRVRLPTGDRFYYPDALVTRRPNPPADYFQDAPAVIFQVLSRRTRRTDEVEKKDAYLTIPSLSAYVLVEQEMPAVVVFRRTGQGFAREVYEGLDAIIPLREIDTNLPLAEIYERVEFTPEPEEE